MLHNYTLTTRAHTHTHSLSLYTASSFSPRHSDHVLPDFPTDLFVRPSFSAGGAYVMWNPVRSVDPSS